MSRYRQRCQSWLLAGGLEKPVVPIREIVELLDSDLSGPGTKRSSVNKRVRDSK
jgi:hypothetical protein